MVTYADLVATECHVTYLHSTMTNISHLRYTLMMAVVSFCFTFCIVHALECVFIHAHADHSGVHLFNKRCKCFLASLNHVCTNAKFSESRSIQ